MENIEEIKKQLGCIRGLVFMGLDKIWFEEQGKITSEEQFLYDFIIDVEYLDVAWLRDNKTGKIYNLDDIYYETFTERLEDSTHLDDKDFLEYLVVILAINTTCTREVLRDF